MKFLKLLRGWHRHVWGFCPKCNCDAPECDTCDICRDHANKVRGQPDSFPFPKVERDVWWERFKALLSIGFVFFLTSCGPFIDTKHGIVSAGFLSSTQAFSGKMKSTDGSSVVWSVTGTDSTSVANNAVGAWGTAQSLKYAFKGLDSNNTANTAQKQIDSNTQLGKAQISADSAATAGKQTIATKALETGQPIPAKP